MMLSNIGQVLGRVSAVNYDSETIFDTFVCYPQPINITKTDEEFSGIDWNDIDPQNGAQPLTEVQAQLVELLRDRIVDHIAALCPEALYGHKKETAVLDEALRHAGKAVTFSPMRQGTRSDFSGTLDRLTKLKKEATV
jgi:hypothetical protein